MTLSDLTVASTARDEGVYSLTLAFDRGETFTTTLGRVTGVAAVPTACVVPVSEDGSTDYTHHLWRKSRVLPMLSVPASSTLTLDGAAVSVSDDGLGGWIRPRLTVGDHLAVLEGADGTSLSRTLSCVAGGLVLIAR